MKKNEMYRKYKEYVASIIGLYKNNGAVSCVGVNFVISSHFTLPELTLYLTDLHEIKRNI